MKLSKTTLILTTMMLTTPCFATAGYLGTSLTEFDLQGCQNDTDSPRCKKVIRVACQSICYGHENEESDLGKACKNMCKFPWEQTETSSNKKENTPLPR